MYPLKAMKTVASILSTTATVGETLTASVDRLGYDYAEFCVINTSVATNKQPTVLKIEEGDTTSSYAAITALTGGTAANTSGFFTIPAGDTSQANVWRLGVDCRARKRYLKFSIAPATTGGTALAVFLGRAEQTPQTTTAAGCNLLVNG